MKKLYIILIFVFGFISIKAQERPNVVLIMTDDQGFGDLGYYGNHHIKTPTLDKLAKESVRFDRFFVSPVCAPTRSSLMTGRYSLRTGVHDTYNGGAIMASNEITIAEVLSKAGYTTGMFGKWHLGDNYPNRPHDQGFQEALYHLAGGVGQPGDWPNHPKGDRSYFDPTLWRNGQKEETKGYCSDVYTDNALDFIEQNKENPFFLYLSFNAPHTPLQLPDKYYEMYKDIDPSAGFGKDTRPFPNMSEKDKEDARKVYGMVTNIDDNVNRVLDQLKKLKLHKNTLVIFMTDNGPQQRRYIAGLRERKGSTFQGGVRVPSFWYMPSKFKGNRDININATHMDVMPTLATLCGAEIPNDRKIDGKNLLPLIDGESPEWKDRPIHFYWNRRYPERYKNMAITMGDYKLVGKNPAMKAETNFELFDISKDPYEQQNLINEMPEKFNALKTAMDNWYIEMINSPNLVNHPKAVIGTKHENPVVFNRNDTFGQEGVWSASEGVYGFWDVEVAEAGYYDFVFKLSDPIDITNGLMKVELGTVVHSVEINGKNIKECRLDNIYLAKTSGRLTPRLLVGKGSQQKRILPFLVEVEKR